MNNKKEIKQADASPSSFIEDTSSKSKQKNRNRKRRRRSSSSDNEPSLPDNTLETERNVHASAIKNNLDDSSVRRILKKVVTNDHVLALVQLREEEEGDSGSEDKSMQPKLTRAKAKQLKKVSPRSTAWDLENLELTPIEQIHVKTRPEVTALIAQDLPDDEEDEEYEPNHDDVLSEDEHEQSCSDLDSQPRTPATPASRASPSPNVKKDGPFKVPPDHLSSARRKLNVDEEEATIAERTRSKLSLSTTTIEHIESSFVPPDALQPPVDDLWSQFLSDCLQPAPPHDDDDDDPEYNAAADTEAFEDDEDILASSLIKISKKELNDLVTELFNVMPATVADEDLTLENLANSVLTDSSRTEPPRFEGKTEPLSDEEGVTPPSKRLKFEKGNNITLSVGKTEREDSPAPTNHVACKMVQKNTRVKHYAAKKTPPKSVPIKPKPPRPPKSPDVLQICIEESNPEAADASSLPPSLRSHLEPRTETVRIELDAASGVLFSPEQLMILKQQLRMHIQLAATNFLQLYIHPVHWRHGPTYKDYLETLEKMSEANENSVVDVCNLKPALEVIRDWEEDVSKDTQENLDMVRFINEQVERNRRRYAQHNLYVGDFHEKFLNKVANSPVFLYPFLLPAMPFRADCYKRSIYLRSEDHLIVLGLDQFRKYIEDNDDIFKHNGTKSHTGRRRSLSTAIQLVSKHMLPWMTPKQLMAHVISMKGLKNYADKNNPIYNYFTNNELPPVEHTILPFNPELTLGEQPEHEMPRIWARHLAKFSKRFKDYVYRRHRVACVRIPEGVPVASMTPETTVRQPLPHDFTKTIKCTRNPDDPLTDDTNAKTIEDPKEPSKPDELPLNVYRLVTTSTGSFLVPLEIVTVPDTKTNDSVVTTNPVTESKVTDSTTTVATPEVNTKMVVRYNTPEHCSCCILLRGMAKRQSLITDYFKKDAKTKKCYCSNVKQPKVTNKLRLLANNFKNHSGLVYNELQSRLEDVKNGKARNNDAGRMGKYTLEELVSVTTFQLKIVSRSLMSKFSYIKVRCKNLLTKFNPDTGDPIRLANSLFKTCGNEMLDLYFDFLEFLTPEQADKLDKFKDYFVRNCAKDLMQKVDEQVKDEEARARILSQLKRVFGDNKSLSCEICSYLLDTMAGYDALAEYTFSLFPHRKEARIPPPCEPASSAPQPVPMAHISIIRDTSALLAGDSTRTEDCEDDVEREADSSSEEVTKEKDTAIAAPPVKQTEKPATPPVEQTNQSDDAKATSVEIKVEPDTTMDIEHTQLDGGCSFIVTLEEVKSEVDEPEWTRAEDKLILEVLKQVTPQERKDKTMAEVLEEKKVLGLISEKIMNKTQDEVRERMMYIMSVLLLSES